MYFKGKSNHDSFPDPHYVQVRSDLFLVDWSGGPSWDKKGDEFSSGLMWANAGNNETSDTLTMSKSVLISLDEGEEVHLVALRNPDGKFPYQGHFITFCASLMEKKFTKANFPGQPKSEYPVLGIRAK